MSDQELLDELVSAYGGAASPIAIINNGLTAQQIQGLYPITASKSSERQVVIFFDNLFKTLGGRIAAVVPVQFRVRVSNGIVTQPVPPIDPTDNDFDPTVGPSLQFNYRSNSMYVGQLV